MLDDISRNIIEMIKFLKIPKKWFLIASTPVGAVFIKKLLVAKIELQINRNLRLFFVLESLWNAQITWTINRNELVISTEYVWLETGRFWFKNES